MQNSISQILADMVSLNGLSSDVILTTHGVPQGSVLGPLLFNLFINDIDSIPDVKKILFADDAAFVVSDSSFTRCHEKVVSVIQNLSAWLENNKLIPNVNKTKLMLVTLRPTPILPDIFFGDTALEWVDNIKYLGLYIDSKLSFSCQVDYVCNKLSRFRGISYALAPLLPVSTLCSLYYSLAYPFIIQNIIIWGGLNQVNSSRIQVAMNKILRNIL